MNHAFDRLARLALALLAATVAACGSGGVNGPVPVNDPTRITILPSTATLYSGLPTTFTISGGTGAYIVSSSNQAVVPVSGTNTSGSITVVPSPVAVETPVTLTVRDTGTAPLATATLTVRPGTVNNEITITPSSTQGGSCAPAICSGSDAIVSARLSQGGVPLPARGVRFDVISGAFRFITSPAGASTETLDTNITVITDETGRAQARLRVTADAANQTAILQVMDLGSGAFQRTSFVIAQATGSSPGFFATPDSVTFTGPRADQCANNLSADFFVFGGTPPYTISNASSGFTVNRTTLGFSGDSFTVTARGVCVAAPGLPIVIRDSTGRSVSVLVANVPGTTPVPDLVVSPDAVTLSSCSSSASVTASGGTGNYISSSGSDAILVTPSGNLFTIQRKPNTPAITASTVTVGISDGNSAKTVTVTLDGEGAGPCPPPLTLSRTSVVLASCTDVQTVRVAGGSNAYTVSSSASSVSATISGSIVSIRRSTGTYTPPATVTVSDSAAGMARTISVSDATPVPPNCP